MYRGTLPSRARLLNSRITLIKIEIDLRLIFFRDVVAAAMTLARDSSNQIFKGLINEPRPRLLYASVVSFCNVAKWNALSKIRFV